MSFSNTPHQDSPLNQIDEYPPLPPSPQDTPSPVLSSLDVDPAQSANMPAAPATQFYPTRPQIHLLPNNTTSQTTLGFRMPGNTGSTPLVFPSPTCPPTSTTPQYLQEPNQAETSQGTVATQYFTPGSTDGKVNLCCDGPLKIAEHSGDEGFDVSVENVNPVFLDTLNSTVLALAEEHNEDNLGQPTLPNLDGTPTIPIPRPPQAPLPADTQPTEELDQKQTLNLHSGREESVAADNQPSSSNDFPSHVNGYSNGIDGLEHTPSFSSEVNKANLAGRYMFSDNTNLHELNNEFPFMVTYVFDFMGFYGIIGYHDDIQQFQAMQAEMKEICDKAKQPLSVSALIPNHIYIFLDPQGDTFRALYKSKLPRSDVCLQLIDIGKFLNSGYESLYPISHDLADVPYLSVRLRLNGVRSRKFMSRNEMSEIGKKFIKSFHIYTARKNGWDKQGYLYIDLIDQTTNVIINHTIMDYLSTYEPMNSQHSGSNFSHFAFPPSTPSLPNKTPQEGVLYGKDISYHELPQYNTCAINTLNITSPILIYAMECHPQAQSKLTSLENDLNKHAPSFPSVTQPEIGMFVIAYRNVNSTWCRAEIVQILNQTLCSLFYLDYGCHEAIAVDKLKLPSPIFMTLPRQALTLSLDNISCINPSGEWDQLPTDFVRSHCINKRRMVRVVNRIEEKFFVNLFEDDACETTINQKLVELGLCMTSNSGSYEYPQQPPFSAPVQDMPASSLESRPSTGHHEDKLASRCQTNQGSSNIQSREFSHGTSTESGSNFQGRSESNTTAGQGGQNMFVPRQVANCNQDYQSNYSGRERSSFQNNKNNYRSNKFNQGQGFNRYNDRQGQGHQRNNSYQGYQQYDNSYGDKEGVGRAMNSNKPRNFNTDQSSNQFQNKKFNNRNSFDNQQSVQAKPAHNRTQSQGSNNSSKGSPRKPKAPPMPDTKIPGEMPIIFASSSLASCCPAFEKAKNDKITVEVTHIESPSDFSVIPVLEKERFTTFIHKLRVTCNANPPSANFTPLLGQMCLYRDDDSSLYRAEVTSLEKDDEVSIYLIDFCKSENTHLANLQAPPYAVLEYGSPLALLCSLHNIRPKAGAWSKSETEIFKSLALNKIFNMTSPDLKNVELWDPSQKTSLNSQFDAIRNRTPTTPIPFEASNLLKYAPGIFPNSGEIQVVVTEILTNKVICVQIIPDAVQAMQVIVSKLQSQNKNFVEQLNPGMPCISQFSEDNEWYRAKVLSVQESGVLVEFVDFGNKEEKHTNQIRALPPDLIEPAPLAHHCLIYQVSEYGENWSGDIKLKIGQHINRQATAVWRGETNRMPIIELLRGDPQNLISMTSDLQQIVNVNLSGRNNPAILPSPLRSNFSDLQPQSLEAGHSYPSVVISCTNPHNISIICTMDLEKLGILSSELIQHSSRVACMSPFVPNNREVCTFHSSSDGKMYRCLVEALNPENTEALVNLIDIVDTRWVELSDIQPLDPSFLALPPLGFHCKLANTAPMEADWSPILLEELSSTLKDKQISVIAKEKVDDLFSIDISTDRLISLIEDLTCRGLVKCTTVTFLNAINLFIQPLPATNEYIQVFILEVKSPDEFYASIIDRTIQNNQEVMMIKLNAYCMAARRSSFQPFIGMLCGSCFSDDTFYRARISAINNTTVTVYYIDFGNFSETSVNELIPLTDATFLNMPAQAINCRLGNVKPTESTWSDEAKLKFGTLTFNKLINAKVLNSEGSVYVLELVDTSSALDINIADELVKAHLAVSPFQSQLPTTVPTYTTQRPIPSATQYPSAPHVNEQPASLPTQYNSIPSQTFYTGTQQPLPTSMSQSQVFPQNVPPQPTGATQHPQIPPLPSHSASYIPVPVPLSTMQQYQAYPQPAPVQTYQNIPQQTPVIQQIPVPPQMQLAPHIQQAPPHMPQPLVVQQAYLPPQMQQAPHIQQAPPHMQQPLVVQQASLPPQVHLNPHVAQQVSLPPQMHPPPVVQQAPLPPQMHPPPITHMQQPPVVQQAPLPPELQQPHVPPHIQSPPVAQQQLLAYPPPPIPTAQIPASFLPTEKRFTCWICTVLSPVELVIQCESLIQKAKSVSDVIVSQIDYAPPLSTAEPGAYCLACFREDRMWYRARVVGINGASVKVEFLDYGNFEEQTLAELRQMPEQLMSIPRLCYNVKLCGVVVSSQKSATDCVKYLRDFQLSYKNLTAQIIDISSSSIELYNSDKNIVDNLILSNCFAVSATPFKHEPIKADAYMKFIVLEIKSPDNFYLNCGEHEAELNSLTEEILNFCSQKATDSSEFVPIRGATCLALYSLDNVWYRACIISLPDPDHVMVQFIDYGNTEIVPLVNIRSIPNQFLTLPAQCIHCTILQPDTPRNLEMSEQFRNAVNGKVVFARSLGPSIENRSYVEILDDRNKNILTSLDSNQ